MPNPCFEWHSILCRMSLIFAAVFTHSYPHILWTTSKSLATAIFSKTKLLPYIVRFVDEEYLSSHAALRF